mmetsp:Transcript_78691/g.197698  ORF Transcript_78691/g.197698 Transcript_78691/m.197698 type:complete len:239 (-) Transcript_78691:258-974(-)
MLASLLVKPNELGGANLPFPGHVQRFEQDWLEGAVPTQAARVLDEVRASEDFIRVEAHDRRPLPQHRIGSIGSGALSAGRRGPTGRLSKLDDHLLGRCEGLPTPALERSPKVCTPSVQFAHRQQAAAVLIHLSEELFRVTRVPHLTEALHELFDLDLAVAIPVEMVHPSQQRMTMLLGEKLLQLFKGLLLPARVQVLFIAMPLLLLFMLRRRGLCLHRRGAADNAAVAAAAGGTGGLD